MLPYPKFVPMDDRVKDMLCYVVTHYGTTGLSVLIFREPQEDKCSVLFGDWHGNTIDIVTDSPNAMTAHAQRFAANDLQKFLKLMHTARIEQAQFFFAVGPDGLFLTDIQKSLNAMVGPGMVRDIFGKIFPTQEVRKVAVIDETALRCIEKGTGTYTDNIILKPSRFRSIQNGNIHQPLYVEIKR